MIRFKCIYCGQRILAQEDERGKKGKCPRCNHLVVVPWSTKGRPAISPNKEPLPDRPKTGVPKWDKNFPYSPVDASDMRAEIYKECFRPFIPTYDKWSLFLMAITLILLCATNIKMLGQMRDLIHHFLTNAEHQELPKDTPFFIIYLAALLLLALIIIPWKEIDLKKWIMLGFAVLTNAGVGIIAGVYVIKNSEVRNWLLVFPVWNIINGALILLMVFLRIIDEECISDRKATVAEIILGLAVVLIIFTFCNFVFKLHWAITFSICVVYTTSFDRALQNVFPGLANRED